MNVDNLSEEELKYIKRAFKIYIMKVIKHSAIDYVRKLKARKYSEIAFSDAVEISVSLSNFDEGTFFYENNSDNLIFSNKNNEIAFYSLTKKERDILLLIIDGYKIEDIAKKMKTTKTNIYSLIYKSRKKFKKKMEEK